MKKRILLPILRSGLVVRGFRGVYLFRKKRESAPSSYSILREEKIVREKGQSREVTYGFDEDYLPRLTYSLSFLEGGRAALDYLSVELLEKKQLFCSPAGRLLIKAGNLFFPMLIIRTSFLRWRLSVREA